MQSLAVGEFIIYFGSNIWKKKKKKNCWQVFILTLLRRPRMIRCEMVSRDDVVAWVKKFYKIINLGLEILDR